MGAYAVHQLLPLITSCICLQRTDKLFQQIVGSTEGEIQRQVLLDHFCGEKANAEVEYYVRKIDVFQERGAASSPGDGLISLEEWHEFFQTLAEEDTFMPYTSPACSKALAALE